MKPILISMPTTQLYKQLVRNLKRLSKPFKKALKTGSYSVDKQIDAVCLNITRRITLLTLLSKYVKRPSLNQYYNAYILPIFDCGCIIWSRCTVTKINRLVKLKKRAARIVLQADFYTPSQSMFSAACKICLFSRFY